MTNLSVIESSGSASLDGLGADVDPRTFRRVCGSFPTGVAIVTTLDDAGRPCGLTVNSFASVSLSPPLVSWCLSQNSPSLENFDRGDAFTISILAEEQAGIATQFARPAPDKFAGVNHRRGGNGVPFVDDCVGYLECRPWNRLEAGDHVIYLWRVERSHLLTLRPPLAFHAGAFKRVEP